MPTIINISEFVKKAEILPIIDVRAPVEFAQGHITGAINLPLFDDGERAEVGTLYRKEGKDPAIDRGLEIAGKKIPHYIREIRKTAVENRLLIHCWRGGMRSSSMAWLVKTAGLEPFILEGGYKAYRRHIRNFFEAQKNIIILSGMTGSGKTEVLYELKKSGEQVIDLEGLAHHRGSAFGSLGMNEQPTTEQFENDTWDAWKNFDHAKVVWLEDESRMIGRVANNESLFSRMRQSQVIVMQIPRSERVKRLLADYAGFNKDELSAIVTKITRRLGGQNALAAVNYIDNGDMAAAIEIVLDYYDKGYTFGLQKRDESTLHFIKLETGDTEKNAARILEFYHQIKQNAFTGK